MKNEILGLSETDVHKSRVMNGSNALTKTEVETFWDKYKGNFEDPIIRVLLVALVINVIFVLFDKAHWYESVGIAVAVMIATLVGTWSEHKNEATFQKLQDDASKILCKVYRDGSIKEILIDDIVAGDYVLLQTGDMIPADGIVYSGDLKVDQATLNGESAEAKKIQVPENYEYDSKLVDYLDKHKLFRGTVVFSGEAVLEVTRVGDKTEYGKLALELQTEDRESPLKVKLGYLAEGISKFGYIGGVLIAIAFIAKNLLFDNNFDLNLMSVYVSDLGVFGNDILTAIILAVIVIVVAVPEGLPMMIAMVLSLNMRKMLNDNILVRKLVGIETAGSLNILFSDKTGTITKGQLEVVSFVDGNNKTYSKMEDVNIQLQSILNLSILNNTNAVFSGNKEDRKIIGGNSTERALLNFNETGTKIKKNIEKVFSIPFSSDKKYSATQVKGDLNLTLIKGAPEKLLDKCTSYYDSDGQVKDLKNLDIINETINELAKRAIRVLAITTSREDLKEDVDIKEMTLVGIVGIRDDVRPEAISAIKEVQNAGIKVVMITGDKKETAVAIAKESGLIKSDDDLVFTSDELQEISDDELKKILPNIKVIARALPTDKSRLVKISQELNLVVGMTGDGVNDAPALKKSDVGFAMGSGTEVAKEAGDIVILDDNFLSIEKAVLYGRTIFKSIRKFIIFQLSINVSAVIISFLGPLLDLYQPLTITQMLWINLIMDTLGALAFGGEPALRRYMNELPKRRDEKIVSKEMWSQIVTSGAFVTIISLIFLLSKFVKEYFRTGYDSRGFELLNIKGFVSPEDMYLLTGFFTFYVLVNVFNGFNARTESLNIFEKITKNQGFIKIMSLIVVIQIFITYLGGVILRSFGLNFREWIFVLIIALLIIPLDIVRKLILKALKNKDLQNQ